MTSDSADFTFMPFDIYKKEVRIALIAAGGNTEKIRHLTNGYPEELNRIKKLYTEAQASVKYIYRSFVKHGLTTELNATMTESDLMHIAMQMNLDAYNRGLLIEYQGRYIEGPVATRLAEALLMAVKMPKLVSSAENGDWVDAGSGTGMAAIAIAACGRNVTGIEKIPLNIRRAHKNLLELQVLTGKTFPVKFIHGKLPEDPLDTMNSHIQTVLQSADVWYCYSWPHDFDESVQLTRVKLFQKFAKSDARLILYSAVNPASFSVDDIQRKGLRPVLLSNGRYRESLAYPDVFFWTVWEK